MNPSQNAGVYLVQVVISWTMVYIRRSVHLRPTLTISDNVVLRRSFFARKFQRIVEAELARNAAREMHGQVDVKIEPWWQRLWTKMSWTRGTRLRSFSDISVQEIGPVKARGRIHLRPDMIRRVEGAPKLVDPSGWISEGVSDQPGQNNAPQNGKAEGEDSRRASTYGESSSNGHTDSTEVEKKERPQTQDEQNLWVFIQRVTPKLKLRSLLQPRAPAHGDVTTHNGLTSDQCVTSLPTQLASSLA